MVKIEKETLKDGSIRWRARGVSTGRDPVTGKRTQRTITGRTQKEVQAEVRIIGSHGRPWHLHQALGWHGERADRRLPGQRR